MTMLSRITSLTRSGLKDWFLQRVSAVILTLYVLFLAGFVIGHHPVDYRIWFALYHNIWMKMFTIITLFALFVHTWVGMWTVYTDYVKIISLRIVLQTLTILVLMAYFIGMVQILWS